MQKTLFEGKFIRLVDNDGWEFADRLTGAGVVCVVALDADHVVLAEEFRSAVQAPVISLPAGLIDRAASGHKQETAIEAALRELREETGYTARSIEEVASGPISAGMTTERMTFFLAQDLLPGEQKLDAGEDIKVHRVPLRQLSGFIEECAARGAEIDPKIFAGLYFVTARGLMDERPLPWWRGWRARVAALKRSKIHKAQATARHGRRIAGAGADQTEASHRDDALARLGKVLNWFGLTVGFVSGAWVLFCLAILFGAFGGYSDTIGMALLAFAGIVIGFLAWLAGRTALYILAGR